jgi:hypothetical protein
MTGAEPDQFQACPACGFMSARIDTGGDEYLIIDSRYPDLMDAFAKLKNRGHDSVIVIDRRVGQNPIAGADRRRW